MGLWTRRSQRPTSRLGGAGAIRRALKRRASWHLEPGAPGGASPSPTSQHCAGPVLRRGEGSPERWNITTLADVYDTVSFDEQLSGAGGYLVRRRRRTRPPQCLLTRSRGCYLPHSVILIVRLSSCVYSLWTMEAPLIPCVAGLAEQDGSHAGLAALPACGVASAARPWRCQAKLLQSSPRVLEIFRRQAMKL